MSELTAPGKPGTACLGCRGRKLKCSREQEGCGNCLKADLPCVYPVPQTGIKRKRGPYRKDKTARERHLEDLVKYLEPKVDGQVTSTPDYARHDGQDLDGLAEAASTASPPDSGARKVNSNSEDLVRDALVALTNAHMSDNLAAHGSGQTPSQAPIPQRSTDVRAGGHPSVRRLFEYWQIYVTRVDPMLKIIHCPTYAKTLLAMIDDVDVASSSARALLYSICHVAVSSCTAKECLRRFGEDRTTLLQRYGRVVEATLADNYAMPDLESLQALVQYIISIRRDDTMQNVLALYSLAVRMAQLVGLAKDPGQDYPPLQVELRRRLWWHICGLESRGAEEGATRSGSILSHTEVRLPGNFNDFDLNHDMQKSPQPRTGASGMSYPLIRFEVYGLVRDIMLVKRNHPSGSNLEGIKEEQRKVYTAATQSFHERYLRHLDLSRPLDWLCITWLEGMLTKARLVIEFPLGQVPTKEMSNRQRHDLLQASVDIIRSTQAMVNHKNMEPWAWYFRGWVQWHAIAVVVAELGNSQNQLFVTEAWAALDPLLVTWDKLYQAKREEPAWAHVNMLIERARQKRQQLLLHNKAPRSSTDVGHTASTTLSTASEGGYMDGVQYQGASAGSAAFETAPTRNNAQSAAATPSGGKMHLVCPDSFVTDYSDFEYIDSLQDIDSSAFAGVFGDGAWDFSSIGSLDAEFISIIEGDGQGW